MNGNVMRVPARSLKEQFSRGSEAWKEQSDPIFRFWAEGDWWGFPFFSLSASRYFGEKQTLCLYWPLATVVIAGPKVLDSCLQNYRHNWLKICKREDHAASRRLTMSWMALSAL